MKVTRISADGRRRSAAEIFIGEVWTQGVIGEESPHLRVSEVHFRDGATNRLHTHTTDQLLIVTEGKGYVGTEGERFEIEAGDVAYIPAGERHWHGARPGEDMTHWAITGASRTEIVAGGSARL
ncbi:MAG TPA: cupin domain-containing protein [Candidatus Limnocylindrales bacterium]|nr:cupin domain-containing protein [Candidatus Limnocylindrales bacterium]